MSDEYTNRNRVITHERHIHVQKKCILTTNTKEFSTGCSLRGIYTHIDNVYMNINDTNDEYTNDE